MFHGQCNRLIRQQADLIDQLTSRVVELEGMLAGYVSAPPVIDLKQKGTVHYLDDAKMRKLEEE